MKKRNLILLITIFSVLIVSSVLAIYYFLDVNIIFEILKEPMTISYYEGKNNTFDCQEIYQISSNNYGDNVLSKNRMEINLDNKYNGDEGKICFMINSTAPKPYQIKLYSDGWAGEVETEVKETPTEILENQTIFLELNYTIVYKGSSWINGSVHFIREE